MNRIACVGLGLALCGCAARAEPIEAAGVVVAAGAAAPVSRGSRCSLRVWPAWRQGVNCQLRLECGGTDLFGGKRIGGYAVCETRDRHFLRARDEEPLRDGDPALDLDVRARRARWRDRDPAATLEIALADVRERPRR
jgi:hypothetical protein